MTDYAAMRDAYLKRLAREASGGGGGDDRFWRPEAGKRYVVRFLPAIPGQPSFVMPYGVHYIEGATEQIVITCPRLTIGQRCPACELAKGLFRGTEKEKEYAGAIYAKKRWVANIVLVSSAPSEVKLWAFGPQVMSQVEEILFEQDVDAAGNPVGAPRVVPIDDPAKGYNIQVTVRSKRTGAKVFPNYEGGVKRIGNPCPIPDPNVLTQLHDYVQIIHANLESYEAIQAKIQGGEEPASEEEPPVDAPPIAKALPIAGTAPVVRTQPAPQQSQTMPAPSVRGRVSAAPAAPAQPAQEPPPAEEPQEEVIEDGEQIVDDQPQQQGGPNAQTPQAAAPAQQQPPAGGGGYVARARQYLLKKRPPGQ